MNKSVTFDHPLMYVEWHDACSPSNPAWFNSEEVFEFAKEHSKVVDVGYLVTEDKYQITLAGCGRLCDEDTPAYHRVVNIPKGCIIVVFDLSSYVENQLEKFKAFKAKNSKNLGNKFLSVQDMIPPLPKGKEG